MSKNSIAETKSILLAGKKILASLKTSIRDMDDVMNDMENSDDHNRTAQKLNDLYVTMDKIPDIPKRPSQRKKRATRK